MRRHGEILTHVKNESGAAPGVTLTTKIVELLEVSWRGAGTRRRRSPATTASFVFNQTATVPSPKLWYPANSVYGKPNMYQCLPYCQGRRNDGGRVPEPAGHTGDHVERRFPCYQRPPALSVGRRVPLRLSGARGRRARRGAVARREVHGRLRGQPLAARPCHGQP